MKRKEWQPTLHLSTLSSSVYTKYTVYAFSKNKYVPLTNEAKIYVSLNVLNVLCHSINIIIIALSTFPNLWDVQAAMSDMSFQVFHQ